MKKRYFKNWTILLFAVFFFSCGGYDLESTVYMGTTKHGTTIGLMIKVDDGELTGYGFHVFSSGVSNLVELAGAVDDDRNFIFEENIVTDESFFGEISGEISKNKKNVSGVWTNDKGSDATEIKLRKTRLTLEQILETIPPPPNRKKSLKNIFEKKMNEIKNAINKVWNEKRYD